MPDFSIDTCLRHAVERSRARTLMRHPDHAGRWTVTLPGAAALTLTLEPDGERLRLWAALGRVSDEQARHTVHALLAHFAAACDHFRVGLGDHDIYELWGHWPIDPHGADELADLLDEVTSVVRVWQDILAKPPVPGRALALVPRETPVPPLVRA
jgi:hypothetical protein